MTEKTLDGSAFGREGLIRICRSLIADELAETRPAAGLQKQSLAWPVDANLRDDGVELDSLELQNCKARAVEYFRLHETGVEDLLLAKPSLEGWADTLEMALPHGSGSVTLQTSGTTGRPKRITQSVDRLALDASAIAGLTAPQRILSLVAPHHVYGAIYTALLPSRIGCPVSDIRFVAPSAAVSDMREGDLLVATPFLLRNFIRQIGGLPKGLTVVCSTSPLPAHVAQDALELGAERVIDVYGSTETLGVGWRDAPEETYRLFEHWSFADDGVSVSLDGPAGRVPLMDTIEYLGDRRFRLLGRTDNVVQVGGVNVSLPAIEASILRSPNVAQAEVRFMAAANGVDGFFAARIALTRECSLSAVERELADRVADDVGTLAVPKVFELAAKHELEADTGLLRSTG